MMVIAWCYIENIDFYIRRYRKLYKVDFPKTIAHFELSFCSVFNDGK